MLADLMPLIGSTEWVASGAAVDVFEGLMRHAGPIERRRWAAVRSRIRVCPANDENRCGACGIAVHACCRVTYSNRAESPACDVLAGVCSFFFAG